MFVNATVILHITLIIVIIACEVIFKYLSFLVTKNFVKVK